MWRPRRAGSLLAVLAFGLVFCLAGCGATTADPHTLRVWLVESDSADIQQGYQNLAGEFRRAHPGINVELSRIPYEQYRDKLVLAVQGGTGPDVMALDQIWTPEFAAAGLIESLDKQLTQAPEVRKDNYFPGAWASNEWEGHTWGLPLNTDVWERMFYNVDLFRKAGLNPDQPPRTWPEWVDASRRLHDLPGAFGTGLIGCRDEAASALTDSLIYSAGGNLVAGAQAHFDSAPNREAYGLYRQLADYAPAGAAGACDKDTVAHFTAGKTGMVLAGGWQESTIKESAKFDWRVATPPAPEGKPFVGALGGYNLAVSSSAPDKRLAFDFAKLTAASPSHQLAVNDSVPALRSAGEQMVRTDRSDPDAMLRLLEEGKPRPVTPVYNRISRSQQDAVQAILGDTAVPEALSDAQAAMQKALDRP